MRWAPAIAAVALLAVSPPTGAARGPGGHHGFHRGPPAHHRHGGSVIVGGGVFFGDPFYPYPYYLPYPAYAYPPPPEESGWSAPEGEEEGESATNESARATYGLVQLRGVPDGAAVDLDGRFWLTADHLDTRWLALPEGDHRLTVHVRDAEPVERRVDVSGGKTHVVRFGPFA